MRRIAFVCLLVLMVLPVYGQSNDLADILSGKVYPLSMKAKDLDSSWSCISVGSNSIDTFTMVKLMSGLWSDYFTKGTTVTIDNETFIVAYGVKVDLIKLNDLRREESPKPLLPETELSLSLLNVRTTGSISSISKFDPDVFKKSVEAAEEDEEESIGSMSMSHLKELAVALLLYAADYDDMLPSMNNPAEVKSALSDHTKNQDIFIDPRTGKPYLPNSRLSKHKMAHIANQADMAVFYEPIPREDGSRAVAFLDSHVEIISAEDWPEVKKVSKIP